MSLCRASLPSKVLTAPPNLVLLVNLLSRSLSPTSKSLMKTLKRTGPRMEPGTPLVTGCQHDVTPFTVTLCIRPVSQLLPRHVTCVLDISMLETLFSCGLDISMKVHVVCFFVTIPYACAGSQLTPPFISTYTFVWQEGSRCVSPLLRVLSATDLSPGCLESSSCPTVVWCSLDLLVGTATKFQHDT